MEKKTRPCHGQFVRDVHILPSSRYLTLLRSRSRSRPARGGSVQKMKVWSFARQVGDRSIERYTSTLCQLMSDLG